MRPRMTWIALATVVLLAPAACAQTPESPAPVVDLPAYDAPVFFGIPIDQAESIVFLMDRSGSLTETLPPAKAELKAAIRSLRPQQKFHVIFFSNGPAVAMPSGKLVPGTKSNQIAAADWIDSVVARGQTDPTEALRMAFAAKPQVIFLVTDGVFGRKAAEQIDTLNEGRTTVVHTVGLCYAEGEEQLKKIAADNGGRCVIIPRPEQGRPLAIPRRPSGTREARCLLRIKGFNMVSEVSPDDSCRNGALHDVLGFVSDEKVSPEIILDASVNTATDEYVDVRIRARTDAETSPGIPPVARELAEAAVARIRERLAVVGADWDYRARERVRPLENALEMAQARLSMTLQEMERFRHNAGGPVEVEVVSGLVRLAEATHQQLNMDLVGKEARAEAIQRKIAALAARAETHIHDDEILKELQKTVNECEALLRAVKETHPDYERLRAAATDARVRLLERREALAQAASGDVLVRLNAELTDLEIDVVEIKARLQETESQRARLRELLDTSVRYVHLADEAARLSQSMKQLQDDLDAARLDNERVRRVTLEVLEPIHAE